MTTLPQGTTNPALAEFDRLIKARAIHMVFQPIVDLETAEMVGFEALARGPSGSRFAAPDALFREAYQVGRVAELDWVCRAAAIRQALAAGLPPDMPLFVNVEPTSLGTPCPEDLLPTITAARHLRIVMEVTERSLARNPAALLNAVAKARQGSIGVALDDVGADPGALAMMSLIRPDVIKLDLRLIQGRTTLEVARIVNAVRAEAERSGAAVLAEGIESTRHIDVARSLGATLGQGWHFGRPGPLPSHTHQPHRTLTRLPAKSPDDRTPFEIVTARRRTYRTTKELLLPMSAHLEYKVLDSTEPMLLLASFQHARHFGDAIRRRYIRMASPGTLVAVLGQDMPPEPCPGVRGGNVRPDDPLVNEWCVAVIGPHFAAALVARDCHDSTAGRQRHLDAVITHDRDLVIDVARPLLRRLVPAAV